LKKKRYDRRGKKVTGGSYKNDDYYRIRVVKFLFSKKMANRSNMLTSSTFGISRLGRERLNVLLAKMVEDGWIKGYESTHVKGVMMYELEDKGRQMATLIQESKDNSHPLYDLDSFIGINDIDE